MYYKTSSQEVFKKYTESFCNFEQIYIDCNILVKFLEKI